MQRVLLTGAAGDIGTRHDERRVGVLRRREDCDRSGAAGEVCQVDVSGRHRQSALFQHRGVALGEARRDLAGERRVPPQFENLVFIAPLGEIGSM